MLPKSKKRFPFLLKHVINAPVMLQTRRYGETSYKCYEYGEISSIF